MSHELQGEKSWVPHILLDISDTGACARAGWRSCMGGLVPVGKRKAISKLEGGAQGKELSSFCVGQSAWKAKDNELYARVSASYANQIFKYSLVLIRCDNQIRAVIKTAENKNN